MIIRRLYTAYALLAFLDQEDPLPQQLRPLLCAQGRFPSRRTWERRLAALPQSLPGLIGCIGRHLVTLLRPWARHGRAVACDSTPLATGGGVWHKKHREQGVIPHSSIDTEAGWSKSGWHGWWYGWKLHLAVTVGALWIPLAAELTVANRGDNEEAPWLLEQLPEEVRYVLGDTHYNTPELRQECHQRGCSNSRSVGCFILSPHAQMSNTVSEDTCQALPEAARQEHGSVAELLVRTPCRRLKASA